MAGIRYDEISTLYVQSRKARVEWEERMAYAPVILRREIENFLGLVSDEARDHTGAPLRVVGAHYLPMTAESKDISEKFTKSEFFGFEEIVVFGVSIWLPDGGEGPERAAYSVAAKETDGKIEFSHWVSNRTNGPFWDPATFAMVLCTGLEAYLSRDDEASPTVPDPEFL